jgi:HSP20 family molecular chaperone IbpA
LIVAASLAIGFGGGFATKELFDKNNSARATEAASVPVQKVPDSEIGKLNRLIAPNLWDIYVDPLLVPVEWSVKPLPLVPLMPNSIAVPKVKTVDSDKEFRVIAQVPGMDEKDVKVEASEHSVKIKAHKKLEEKNNGKFEAVEESFEQSVHLPADVDAGKVQASVKDGVLTVMLPKKQVVK